MKDEDCCWCPYYSQSMYNATFVVLNNKGEIVADRHGDDEQTCRFSGHQVDIHRLRRCPQLHPFENNGV